MWFTTPAKLNRAGVVGINERNGNLIMRYNERRLYPLVDNKILTKQLAEEAGMAVPKLYAVIETQHDVARLETILEGREQFVMKPAHGSGGDGILVIENVTAKGLRRHDGTHLSFDEARYHASTTLSGQYSLGGLPDKLMVEYRVQFDPLFEKISYQGVPDIRVIVFQGYPVMSMVRLPTRVSGGKANLHQGAIGVGIDLSTGTTTSGSIGNEIIAEHPDTGNAISGLTLPGWQSILELAARCFDITGLGYLGVDIVLDKERGALILELNARPGLNIQIANFVGLGARIDALRSRVRQPESAEARVAHARQAFAQ
ncbi:MAG: alpha-L-glutamate ligase-like protein [Pseudomonadota bacterium]